METFQDHLFEDAGTFCIIHAAAGFRVAAHFLSRDGAPVCPVCKARLFSLEVRLRFRDLVNERLHRPNFDRRLRKAGSVSSSDLRAMLAFVGSLRPRPADREQVLVTEKRKSPVLDAPQTSYSAPGNRVKARPVARFSKDWAVIGRILKKKGVIR